MENDSSISIDEYTQRLADRTASNLLKPPSATWKPGDGMEYVDAWRHIVAMQRLLPLFQIEKKNLKRLAAIIGISRQGLINYIKEELGVPIEEFRRAQNFPELLSLSPVGQWLNKETNELPPKSQRREGRTQRHHSTRGSASIFKKLMKLSSNEPTN